jgi:hypothetical protein
LYTSAHELCDEPVMLRAVQVTPSGEFAEVTDEEAMATYFDAP